MLQIVFCKYVACRWWSESLFSHVWYLLADFHVKMPSEGKRERGDESKRAREVRRVRGKVSASFSDGGIRREKEWWIDWEWEHHVTQTCCDGGMAWWRDKETGDSICQEKECKGRERKRGRRAAETCYFLISLPCYLLTFLVRSQEPLCKRTVTTWPHVTERKMLRVFSQSFSSFFGLILSYALKNKVALKGSLMS